jgi:protein-S-isoprenylcysteine O-methyltransferase Ste14
MTRGHLLFSVMTTAYILIAIRFEERDIARLHGAPYEEYRRRVPRLLPLPRWRNPSAEHVAEKRGLT